MKNLMKIIRRYLPIIGILLFFYILIKMGIFNVFNEIVNAKLSFLLIALFFVLISLIIQTFKWYIIAHKQKINIPFQEAFKINLISDFYGFVTPAKLGVITRADYLKKYSNNNIAKGICNVTLDKILDLVSVLFMAILFSLIFQEKFSFFPVYYLIAIFFGIILMTFIFIDKKRSTILLRVIYRKLIPKKIKEKARIGFDSFYDNIPKRKHLMLFFLVNLLNWVIIYTITFFVGLSLGINLPFIYFLAIIPIGTLVGLIPITINGLGTREAVLITLFSLFSISATKVFSMSLVNIFLHGIIPAFIAIFLIFKIKKDNEKISEEIKDNF